MLLLGTPRQHKANVRPRRILRRGLSLAVGPDRYLVRGPRGSRKACLTFDDGPHPEHTPAILKILNYFGVQATFFVVGENVVRYPELIQQIAVEGHLIGQRGYFCGREHTDTEEEFIEEFLMTDYRINQITGSSPRLIRPRLGDLAVAKLRRLWHRERTMVMWNHDSGDGSAESAADLSTTFEKYPIRGRDIVRFHDTQPHAAFVLPQIIPNAIRLGVGFGTPVEWIAECSALEGTVP